MARNGSHFTVNWPTSWSNEYRRQNKKKNWRRPTHGLLHLKSLNRQVDEGSCKLKSFRLVFLGRSVASHFVTINSQPWLSISAQTSLKHYIEGCSSSSWVAAYLGSTTSLSISEKKGNNPHLVRKCKSVISSSHRRIGSRSNTKCSFARTLSPRTLSTCRRCFGPEILGAYACLHPFSSLLRCLVVMETN